MLRLLPRKRRARLGLIGATIAAVLLTMGVHASSTAEQPATQENLLTWNAQIVEAPRPSLDGCFDATYPKVVWRETACVDQPAIPMSPNRVPAARRDIGGGTGMGIVTERPADAGDITRATGTFEDVKDKDLLTVNSSPTSGPAMANSYTLQLNTNHLKVRECASSPTPALCEGWKQFIFANTPQTVPNEPPSRLYIDYWLLAYNPDASQGKPCPRDWTEIPDDGEVHCWLRRERAAGPLPYVPIGNIALPGFKLEAQTQTIGADTVVDVVTFNDGNQNAASTSSSDVLHVLPGESRPDQAGPGWTQVEFNVFGFGNGSTAVFNKEADFNLRTTIVDGSPKAPECKQVGYSKERNNLNFAKPSATPTSPAPALIINQAAKNRELAGCRAAVAVGDTHQYTFAGTYYDFQATGDFVEARAGTTFEVQTRKKSGAPTWPNASMNQSVGVRMGNTRLAVCAGTRLVVNGVDTNLPSGESLLLSTGVAIDRVGDVYTFRDPSGNLVRSTAIAGTVPYVNLGINLGSETPAVRGLLGNHNGDPNFLEASNGDPLRVPLSFADMYGVFGNSWRVSHTTSLLRFCEAVDVGNPAAPFYSHNLPADVLQRAKEYCATLRLEPTWNISCELDFAVLGRKAADVFDGLPKPTVDGNPKPPSPSPSPTGGNSACRIAYTVNSNSASASFTGNVTITNTSNTPVNGWTLTFSFTNGQRITSSWNASVTQSNALVTARNLSHNGTLAPGASTSFGFLGNGGISNPPPVGWTLNGSPCTT
ncbi:cellulose binding domain-containing protein [Micromonospora sp. NPDC051196]|uniref:cellulose binding domain-containing protein n=1 Tax=Micromonospora sp. NPDC051196 TaxID=3155281 RepID=UPI00343221B5